MSAMSTSAAPTPTAPAAAATAGAPAGTVPELPWSFHECPTETLVVLIAHMLNLLIEHNDQVVLTPDSLTRFHSRAAPGITVIDYLQRIVKYTNMEKIPLLSLLSYIDRTCTNLPTFTLSSLTVHRFLIAGVCAGSKAQCDVFCTNSHYAKVGGIKVTELNGLEREFLKVTDWDLCCKAELLQRYYTSLIKSHGGFTQAAEPIQNPYAVPPPALIPEKQSQQGDQGDEAPGATQEEGMEEDAGPVAGPSTVPVPRPVDIPRQPRARGNSATSGPHSVPEGRQASFSGGHRPSASHTTTPLVNSAPDTLVTGATGMDVDQISPAGASANERSSSVASSSVPSSSRSSLRTCNVSMTQYEPSAGVTASPRVDTTPATGRVGMEVDDDTDIGARGPPPPGAPAPAPPALQEPDDHGHAHVPQYGFGGGKLLKSLVGGIFRRHDSSAHHSDPPPPHPPTASAPGHSSNNNNQRLVPPGQSPGRRVKSPLMTAYSSTQGEPPSMAAPVTPRVRNREEATSEC